MHRFILLCALCVYVHAAAQYSVGESACDISGLMDINADNTSAFAVNCSAILSSITGPNLGSSDGIDSGTNLKVAGSTYCYTMGGESYPCGLSAAGNATCDTSKTTYNDCTNNIVSFTDAANVDVNNALKYELIGGNGVDASIWALNDGVYFALLIDSGGETALIDCPETEGTWNTAGPWSGDADIMIPTGEYITQLAKALTGRGITKLIMSHDHWDHVGVCGVVYHNNPGITEVWSTTYYNQITADRNYRLVANSADSAGNTRALPMATNIVKAGGSMKVGSVTIEFDILNGHDKEDGVFIIKADTSKGIKKSILFTVDVIMPGYSYFMDMSQTSNLAGYRTSLVAIQTYAAAGNADLVVGGHYSRYGIAEDNNIAVAFYDDLLKGANLAKNNVPPSNAAMTSGYVTGVGTTAYRNLHLFMDAWIGGVKQYCANWVLDTDNMCTNTNNVQPCTGYDYVAKLAGVQINVQSHCYRMFFQLLLNEDYTFVGPTTTVMTVDTSDSGLSDGQVVGIVCGVAAALIIGFVIGAFVRPTQHVASAVPQTENNPIIDENNDEMGKSNADRSPKHKVPEMGSGKSDDHVLNDAL